VIDQFTTAHIASEPIVPVSAPVFEYPPVYSRTWLDAYSQDAFAAFWTRLPDEIASMSVAYAATIESTMDFKSAAT
jgi:hypothetical protein